MLRAEPNAIVVIRLLVLFVVVRLDFSYHNADCATYAHGNLTLLYTTKSKSDVVENEIIRENMRHAQMFSREPFFLRRQVGEVDA